jgi:CheY-like chemotaxis protein
MVIDDDLQDLDRTLEGIRRLGFGYEARIALGGFEALDYLLGRGRFHERRRHPLPDLILLDLGMQPLDGLAVLRRIKDVEFLRRIPVVILCNSEPERERVMRDAVPECAYAVKPMSPGNLEDLLRDAHQWTLESNPKVYAAMRLE